MSSVGEGREWDRVARVKSPNRSRSITVRHNRPAPRNRRQTRSTSPINRGVQLGRRDRPRPECALRADRPASPADHHRRAGRGCGPARAGAGPIPAEHRDQCPLVQLRRPRPTVVIPRRSSLAAVTCPRPRVAATGSGCRKCQLAVDGHDQQPVRLGDAAGHLGQELGPGDTDGDGQADPRQDLGAQPRGDLRRRSGDPPQPVRRPGKPRRWRRPRPTAWCRGRRRTRPCWPPSTRASGAGRRSPGDTNRRAWPPVHGCADAEGLRLVAGREHDPAADDDRPPAQPRVVALLDRGVEAHRGPRAGSPALRTRPMVTHMFECAEAEPSGSAEEFRTDLGLEDLADLGARQVGPDLDLLRRLDAADPRLDEGGELARVDRARRAAAGPPRSPARPTCRRAARRPRSPATAGWAISACSTSAE